LAAAITRWALRRSPPLASTTAAISSASTFDVYVGEACLVMTQPSHRIPSRQIDDADPVTDRSPHLCRSNR
jgi:hypothetical protein